MDKETYKALKVLVKGVRSGSMNEEWNEDMEKGYDELPKIESWIDEVVKEYTEEEENICEGCGEPILENQAVIKGENRHSACC